MVSSASPEGTASANPPHYSEVRRILKVMFTRKLVLIGVIIVVLMAFVAVFAHWMAPYSPYETNLKQALQPISSEHLLGTDALGRDLLSRLIYGSRTSLIVGFVSIAIAASLGMTLGMLAGFFGGKVNMIIMRFIDALMAFPMILLALVVASLLGGGLVNIMIAIGIALTSVYARLTCGQVLSIKELDYITASRAAGGKSLFIIMRHIFPNCFPPLIVLVTMQMGSAILAEAGLSYLGVGIAPPGAAWGAMVNDGYKYLLKMPMLSFAPGVAIMLVVFAFNMVGDGLRDALDPRLRGLV